MLVDFWWFLAASGTDLFLSYDQGLDINLLDNWRSPRWVCKEGADRWVDGLCLVSKATMSIALFCLVESHHVGNR